jgi:hypothetical protein
MDKELMQSHLGHNVTLIKYKNGDINLECLDCSDVIAYDDNQITRLHDNAISWFKCRECGMKRPESMESAEDVGLCLWCTCKNENEISRSMILEQELLDIQLSKTLTI